MVESTNNSNGHKEKVVISLGGSLVVPNGGIDIDFLSKFNRFLRDRLAEKERQFFLVVGGGATARHYGEAAEQVLGHEITRDDLDWLGIHSTRLNAHLIRTIFRNLAHPYIIDRYDIIIKPTEPIIVAAGWKPGWSTDYDATLICEDYNVRTIINLSNITQVYDKDPHEFTDAKPIDKMSWEDFRKLVGDDWTPGMHAPFDPIAAKKAQEMGVKVVVLNGKNFENLEKYFRGEEYVGTVIG